MNPTRCFLKLSPLFASTLLAACASAPRIKPSAMETFTEKQPVHVEGVLTDNGMGCTALRTQSGALYTFARDLEGSKMGEHLWVDGYVTTNSRGCRQGTNLMPERAGRIDDQVAGNVAAAVSGTR